MAIESYVEDILDSSESTFRKIISTIVAKSDKSAKIEIVRQHTQVDTILFEAIKSILNDLRKEEGVISRLLYKFLGIEIFKNKKREQLIILGSELKTKKGKIKREKNRVSIHISNILSSLENLELLKDSFYNKSRYFQSKKDINRGESIIKRISNKIDELNTYRYSLEQKQTNICDTEKIYNSLYLQIPRYYELKEEIYIKQLTVNRV